MPWKIAKLKNGQNKDYTKELFEKISDKEASRYGAKIIDKSPKNSHKKYTMWQAEAIYKTKIQSCLDFCLSHSSSIEDFIEKTHALDVFFKWATYRLLDEPQLKNTRGRSLNKKEVTHYEYDSICEKIKKNQHTLTVQQVVHQYEKINEKKQQSLDYQLSLESWQISYKTEKCYYLNVDFGFDNRGQIFI